MESIPKSNLFIVNKVVRLHLLAIEEVIGKKGLNAVLNLAKLSHLIDNYPPEDLEKQFDIADFSTIILALEEIYGDKGGRLLCSRAGKVYFSAAVKAFGSDSSVFTPEFSSLPVQEKLHQILPLIAQATISLSDQEVTVEERGNDYIYNIINCSACWGRSGQDKPVCAIQLGFLQGVMELLAKDKKYSLVEEKCCAVGDPFCQFVITIPTEG